MTIIRLDACLQPDNESVYDSHTRQFVFMLDQLIDAWKIRSADHEARAILSPHMNMSRSVVDMGWIPRCTT